VLEGGTRLLIVHCAARHVKCLPTRRPGRGRPLFCCAYLGTDEDLEAGKRLGAILTVSVGRARLLLRY